jgi:SulP family sulfate permease
MVVGALIFVLGIDLVKESLWDTRHRVSRYAVRMCYFSAQLIFLRAEYVTIMSIMVCMTVWDFVTGVIFGIIVSCEFFVNVCRRSC